MPIKIAIERINPFLRSGELAFAIATEVQSSDTEVFEAAPGRAV